MPESLVSTLLVARRRLATVLRGECRELNPEGEFTFIQANVSLLKGVDDVCREIKSKEKIVNLLFLTCGSALTHAG